MVLGFGLHRQTPLGEYFVGNSTWVYFFLLSGWVFPLLDFFLPFRCLHIGSVASLCLLFQLKKLIRKPFGSVNDAPGVREEVESYLVQLAKP